MSAFGNSSADQHAPGEASFSFRDVLARQGANIARGTRFAIVVSRFNSAVTDRLYAGAVATLLEAGVAPNHIAAVQVPGAVEIPLACDELADTRHYAGIVALGCVIRGETSHYDYVCAAASRGCMDAQSKHNVPVGFGVLTCETVEQANARSRHPDDGGHNVGSDAALAALEMAGLVLAIRGT